MHAAGTGHRGLREVVGDAAWLRLPLAVRARFGEPVVAVDYVGEFEIVRASWLGRMVATVCRLIGTPVVPHTGLNIPAIVHVGPVGEGVALEPGISLAQRGALSGALHEGDRSGWRARREASRATVHAPRRLRSRRRAHFVSRGYYFDVGRRDDGSVRKFPLPAFLSPGVTHVEHHDESGGWFRFTMTVRHPFFGEMFFQTGRFRAAGSSS